MDKNNIDFFGKLYSAEPYSDFVNALEYKKKLIPKYLYRYRSLETPQYVFDEILDGTVWLSSINKLNDEFDSQSFLCADDHLEYIRSENTRQWIIAHMKQSGINISSEVLEGKQWYRKYLRALETLHFVDGEKTDMDLEVIDRAVIEPELELLNSRISEVMQKLIKVACFSERWNNTAMWYHYANCHKGVCIEYNITTLGEYAKNRLFPISYHSQPFDAITFLQENLSNKNIPLFERIASHKTIDWINEEEWRFIHVEYLERRVWENIDGFKMFFALPSKVILGSKISDTNKSRIRDICSLKHIAINQITMTSHGLDLKPI